MRLNPNPGAGLAQASLFIGDYALRPGEVGVVSTLFPFGDVRRYGAKADGVTDDAPAIQAAVNAVENANALGGKVRLAPGVHRVNSTIQINTPSMTVEGAGEWSTALLSSVVGPLFQLGTDDGNAYDLPEYNGIASNFTLRECQAYTTGTAHLANYAQTSGVANGGLYLPGSYLLRDWRGGSLRVSQFSFRNFDFGFWGIQSDINCFEKVTASFNNTAFWFGPRCDQQRLIHVTTMGNVCALSLNGVDQMTLIGYVSDTDGGPTTYPVSIHAWAATNRINSNIAFINPWFESLGSFGTANPGYDVSAFIDLAIGDTAASGPVALISPFVLCYDYSDVTKPHVQFLARSGTASSLTVQDIGGSNIGQGWTNLRAVFRFDAGAVTPRVWFREADITVSPVRLAECYNAANAFIRCETQGFNTSYLTNVVGGTQPVRIGYFGLQRSLQHNSTAPTAGQNGDLTLNSGYAQGADVAWVWSGARAFPLQVPSFSGDRGDASVTLTPGTDNPEQGFSTTLTANRTVTLSTTGVLQGHYFRIVRTAGGAFTLSIGGIINLPQNGWCIVQYNGGAWEVRASGSVAGPSATQANIAHAAGSPPTGTEYNTLVDAFNTLLANVRAHGIIS